METLDFCFKVLFYQKGIDVSVGHVKAYYHENFDTLVIFGSNDIEDWFMSLDVLPVHQFHRGYYRAAKRLITKLDDMGIEPGRIVGYSVGGAIASVMAVFYDVPTISIGSPNYLYGLKHKDVNLTHYVIKEDIITWLPISLSKEGRILTYETKCINPFKAHSLDFYGQVICDV